MLSLLTTPGFTENVSPHGLLGIIHTAMHIVQLNKSLLDQLGRGTQKTTEILLLLGKYMDLPLICRKFC